MAGYRGGGDVVWEATGGINPVGEPVALCVGGTNRLTGELAPGFWGASCDADEAPARTGLLRRGDLVPRSVLVKAHMPDLADVLDAFNVESIENRPDEYVKHRVARKVEFESIEFNRRFLVTVPREYGEMQLRELFSPGFLAWATTIDREVDFGINDRQLWFLWRLAERSEAELKLAFKNAGELFQRLHVEMGGKHYHRYPPGPWNAGQAPFPEP